MQLTKTLSIALLSSALLASPAFAAGQVTAAEAAKTALKKIGGGQVGEVDFEREYGKSYYDVDVYKNGQKYVVRIDAKTGAVLHSYIDHDD